MSEPVDVAPRGFGPHIDDARCWCWPIYDKVPGGDHAGWIHRDVPAVEDRLESIEAKLDALVRRLEARGSL